MVWYMQVWQASLCVDVLQTSPQSLQPTQFVFAHTCRHIPCEQMYVYTLYIYVYYYTYTHISLYMHAFYNATSDTHIYIYTHTHMQAVYSIYTQRREVRGCQLRMSLMDNYGCLALEGQPVRCQASDANTLRNRGVPWRGVLRGFWGTKDYIGATGSPPTRRTAIEILRLA